MIKFKINGLGGILNHHANTMPSKTAISDYNDTLSYGDIEKYSTSAAFILESIKINYHDPVLVIMGRSVWVPVIALGVFKSGLIYTPVDPGSPEKRLEFLIQYSSCKIIITDKKSFEKVKKLSSQINEKNLRILLAEDMLGETPLQSTGVFDSNKAQLDEPAYCIYTSGSTGTPKGVLISHRSALHFFDSLNHVCNLNEKSKFLSFSPMHFDATIIDVFHTLYRGGDVFIYNDIIDSKTVLDLIKKNNITHFSAFGPLLKIITDKAELSKYTFPHLKKIIVGAEIPHKKSIQEWIAKEPNLEIINAYGPTEATVAVSTHIINHTNVNQPGFYPIGKPLPGNTLKIIDIESQEVSESGTGELILAGPQLFMEYVGSRPGENSHSLELNGVRFYRTGDICSVNANGDYFYEGRLDDEVKISGLRVNLTEIKYASEKISYVKTAEAFAQTSHAGEVFVLLVIQKSDSNHHLDSKDLREGLRKFIPNYMLPRKITEIDKFPINANGKTDRKQLLSLVMRNN